MATALPPDHAMRVPRRPRAPRACPALLPRNHVQDLQDVAQGAEETAAGLSTKYLAQADGGPDAHDDERLLDAERVCGELGVPLAWFQRLRRCRRALASLRGRGDHRSADVLLVAYGPEDPSTREWTPRAREYVGRTLAGLVRYTDATEERRRAIVLRLAKSTRVDLAGAPLADLRKLVDLARVRDRVAYWDRIVTSGDALRDAMRPAPEAKDAAARAVHLERRNAFLVRARAEAEAMLSGACRAYHAAWLATAP